MSLANADVVTRNARPFLRPNRWDGIERPYSAEEVERLRGSVRISHTLAERGARRLWELLHLDDGTIARFQRELGAMGYRFQFVTLAGFHALNYGMYELACQYRDRGMAAYAELQQTELAAERGGYTAARHKQEVGTGYFDSVIEVLSAGAASTLALRESTETDQF
jgi:isocitrate lyase